MTPRLMSADSRDADRRPPTFPSEEAQRSAPNNPRAIVEQSDYGLGTVASRARSRHLREFRVAGALSPPALRQYAPSSVVTRARGHPPRDSPPPGSRGSVCQVATNRCLQSKLGVPLPEFLRPLRRSSSAGSAPRTAPGGHVVDRDRPLSLARSSLGATRTRRSSPSSDIRRRQRHRNRGVARARRMYQALLRSAR